MVCLLYTSFGLFCVCGDGSIKREITDFESPIEVDIDKKIPVLVAAHTALYDCINAVIGEICLLYTSDAD